jgi:hypothetical protein
MTDLQLPDFEGTPVYSAAMVVRNLGDGLSKAVATDPRALHQRDKVFFVVEGEVVDVSHPLLKDTDGLTRKHVVAAQLTTFVDESIVRDMLDAQQIKNDELAGIQQLPMDEAAAAELAAADAEAQAVDRDGEPEPTDD